MKRTNLLTVIVIALLILTGCSSANGSAASSTGSAIPAAGGNGTAGTGQMPESLQLAIAMFKLDQTSYPLSKEQAATLLFLWKGARTLSSNDTVSSEELNGLYKQIQAVLTSNQLKAIEDMNLKMSDLQTLSQELGIQLGMGRPAGSTSATPAANSTGGRQGGGFGGGMPPMGGGGPPGGGFMGSSSSGSTPRVSQSGSFMGISSELIDQIINYLAAKV